MSVTRKTVQTLGGHLLIFVQGLVLTPFIIKLAGVELFGAYSLLISYMSILFGISSMGVGISAKRWLPSVTNPTERASRFYPQFWFQVVSVFALGLLSAIAYLAFAVSLQRRLPSLSAWMVPVYLLAYAVYSQTTDYFRYTHRVGTFNLSTIAQPYLFVCLVLGVYGVSGVINSWSLVASLTIASAMIGGLLFLRIYREIGMQFCLPEIKDLGKEIRLGFPVVLSYLVDVILSGGDRYIIAAMLSVKDVGVYVPAYALGSLVMVLPKVFGVVLPPLLSRKIDAGDDNGAQKLTNSAVRVFLLLSIPYFFGAAILGEDILRLYTNDEIALAAWPVISIVSLASIFYGLILLRSNILFVRLRTRLLMEINFFSAVLNIVLNIVLIEIFGNVKVVALATLASYLFSFFLLKQRFKGDLADFTLEFMWLVRVLICSVGMSLTLLLLQKLFAPHGLASVGFSCLIGVITYLALSFMQRSNRSELVMLVNGLRAR